MIIKYRVSHNESSSGKVFFTGGDYYLLEDGIMIPFKDVISKNGRGGARPSAGRKSREELGLEPTKQIYGYVPESLYSKAIEKAGTSMSSLLQSLLQKYVDGEQ